MGVALRTCSFIKVIADIKEIPLAVTLEGVAPNCYGHRDFLFNKTRAAHIAALPLPCRVAGVSFTPQMLILFWSSGCHVNSSHVILVQVSYFL